jgi:hypothetical protein
MNLNKTKIKRAASLTGLSYYPSTWEAILYNIPNELIASLTSKQLAAVIYIMQDMRIQAANREIEIFADHHNIKGNPWGARLAQTEIKE